MPAIDYTSSQPDAAQYLALFETTGWNEKYKVDQRELKNALDASWHVVSAYEGKKLVGLGRIVTWAIPPTQTGFGRPSGLVNRF